MDTHPRTMAPALAFLFALAACESNVDKARRLAAEEEARLYGDEAARLHDKGERTMESVEALKLRHLAEARSTVLDNIARAEESSRNDARSPAAVKELNQKALAEHKARLTSIDHDLAKQRALVEGIRDKIVKLKKDTEALAANPRADAGVGRAVILDRLKGLETELADVEGALASDRDGG